MFRSELGTHVRIILMNHEDIILGMVRDQLLDGIRGDGEDIRPYYSEDTYFETRAQANQYIAWKKTIRPNARRNPDAPNLFINGKFHSELGCFFNDTAMTIKGATFYAEEIVWKYGLPTFGLTDEHAKELADNYVLPALMRLLKSRL